MNASRRISRLFVATVTLAAVGVGVGLPPSGPRGKTHGGPLGAQVSVPSPTVVEADELLANRYHLGVHRVVVLPRNLTWREDPLHEKNWLFLFHSLRWIEPLWLAWRETREVRYRDRYTFILRDWFEDNPRSGAPSPASWDDHATAYRGIAYARALKRLAPPPAWLRDAAALHAKTLADPSFYVHHGNHALNQSIGLLELGCALGDDRRRDLATSRIEDLIRESVDTQGVSNEQADSYDIYNYKRYLTAIDALEACGVHPSATLRRRVELMPRFMAWAAMPNGRKAMIGDSGDDPILSVPGTEAEFVTTGGRSGARPRGLYAVFSAGYASFRSGWGTERPLADETDVLVRFGPGKRFHGHFDPASVVVYAFGDRILMDAGGPYRYVESPWQTYFVSEEAHNTISVDGAPMRPGGATDLIAQRHATDLDFIVLGDRMIPGVDHVRRVVYSRLMNAIVVEDQLTSSSVRTFHQWWHLHPEARPVLGDDRFTTGRADGPNAYVRQLIGGVGLSSIRGQTSPIQGWITPAYGIREPATAVAFSDRGRSVRFVTLIIPFRTEVVTPSIERFTPRPGGGFDLVMTIAGRRAEVAVAAESASEIVSAS